MKRRVINITNNSGLSRNFKFLADGTLRVSTDNIEGFSVHYDDNGTEMIINKIEFKDGPNISVNDYITFPERGKIKITSIHPCLLEKPVCFVCTIL